LRSSLKKDGFNQFNKLEGDRNRRGSTIYLPVGLLIMRRRKGEKFEKFVDQYIKELEILKGK
jgi:hypothetical protein